MKIVKRTEGKYKYKLADTGELFALMGNEWEPVGYVSCPEAMETAVENFEEELGFLAGEFADERL